MKILRLAPCLCAVSIGFVGPLFAHGGTYKPIPPPFFGPSESYPGQRTGAGAGAGPYGPAPGLPNGGAPGPNTPGGMDFGADMTAWSWWWEFNKEKYLELRARLRDEGAASGSDGFFLGRGQKTAARDVEIGPSTEQIRGEIIPALLRLLDGERAQAIRTGCLIALARIGEDDESSRKELDPILRGYLQEANATVVETAVIALGILGNEATAFLLADLLRDTEAGQRAVGKEEVPRRVRTFAAYALGLLGHRTDREDVRRFAVHALTRGIEEDDTASPDLSVACVIALGRVPLRIGGAFPDPGPKTVAASSASLEAQTAYLIALLGDERKLHRMARAHVPTSLGLLAADPALDGSEVKARVADALFERLSRSRREDDGVLQSCAIALGLIGDVDADHLDGKIRSTLIAFPSRIDDKQAKRFALLSEGLVAARTGTGDAGGVADLRNHLLRQFSTGRGDTPHWAGLALGLLGRSAAGRGIAPSTELVRALHTELRQARSPYEVGAYCIASGLLREMAAAPLMRDKLERLNDDWSRGYAAVGLGLLGDRGVLETIRRLADEST